MSMKLNVARSELILGGQKSGKSRRAEELALAWLDQDESHRAVLIATAQPWDEEMRERIERHKRERAARVPRLETVEEPLALAEALTQLGRADTLLVVDCLTLWLTNRLMPVMPGEPPVGDGEETLAGAIARCAGPLVLVSNEIGLGVIPMGRDTRAFVDSLGRLNQTAALACERVTLMAAGQPLMLKGAA
ncbi:bifunctional adenosylcobinamide kinase/adenosylcobinamide-phosphate guanylyltransferase [Caldimonas tepidiphila]|uniref:bifunctional adenosylcobinamide kinase/adenosylcobinamide-phosphate guanylyltransferase n=1 Tax=Caldimonas tepidiphila TaxID=2315841 RepID=UPI000E5C5275|nr:bifunctional adenosylcobinamide kinase/adenosylcobinamide-phosphate guanylyltransferase [Caldimonas tepidiphila]